MSLGCRAALLQSQEPGEAASLGDSLGCEVVTQCWGSNAWQAMLDQCFPRSPDENKNRATRDGFMGLEPVLGLF